MSVRDSSPTTLDTTHIGEMPPAKSKKPRSGDMLNGHGIMDQGCMLWLIDECSATALAAQSFVGGQGEGSGVSQTMNVTFHSPAALGTRLRIINTTMGTTVKECQSEMWDQDNQRLVVKGMQIMMQPQPGKQYIWRPTPIVP
ncbi:hypothetical protein BD779DRAFT_1532324 [Infundibulicybe gibba]|nr:hypothetical protein BD779DRAFT_1532324 [Infundibulicybe gibba]